MLSIYACMRKQFNRQVYEAKYMQLLSPFTIQHCSFCNAVSSYLLAMKVFVVKRQWNWNYNDFSETNFEEKFLIGGHCFKTCHFKSNTNVKLKISSCLLAERVIPVQFKWCYLHMGQQLAHSQPLSMSLLNWSINKLLIPVRLVILTY